MSRTAIVVHTDESVMRLVSKGLSAFEPQYKVVTARTLSGADDWMLRVDASLLLIDGDANATDDILGWSRSHGVDLSRIFILSSQPGSIAVDGLAGVLPYPMRLSMLLDAVVAFESPSSGVEHTPTNEVRELSMKMQHPA